MGKYSDEYNKIMEQYRNGEFGEDNLSVYDILSKAGKPNLLEKMSIEELQELYENSSGMFKTLFRIQLLRKKEMEDS